jgi:hypothetical protein
MVAVLLGETVPVADGEGDTVSVSVGSENQLFVLGIFKEQAENIIGNANNMAIIRDSLPLLFLKIITNPDFCMITL